MKFKTTRKAIMNNYRYVLEVGYCDLAHLLTYKNPIAYTCGAYGWNSDIYQVTDNFVICTGYRPFGNIKSIYEYNSTRESYARTIVNSWEIPLDKKKRLLDTTLQEIIDYYTETEEE